MQSAKDASLEQGGAPLTGPDQLPPSESHGEDPKSDMPLEPLLLAHHNGVNAGPDEDAEGEPEGDAEGDALDENADRDADGDDVGDADEPEAKRQRLDTSHLEEHQSIDDEAVLALAAHNHTGPEHNYQSE